MPSPKQSPDAQTSDNPIWMADKVVQTPIDSLEPYTNNNRIHTTSSIAKLQASVSKFGFVAPILIDRDGVIIAGHGRCEVAKALGLKSVPTVVIDHLGDAEIRALRIADNKLAELSDWDEASLKVEFEELMELSFGEELDFDLAVTGFEMPEIDIIVGGVDDDTTASPEAFEASDPATPPVTQAGDLWVLGDHQILCGNALEPQSYEVLLKGSVCRLIFTDPPYNVAVNGHVRSGNGGHREFAMASGEMSGPEFQAFLDQVTERLAACLPEGGIAMVCMDWRHIQELIAAGKAQGFDLLNLCVWNKTNGGMGSLYRSKHELIAVFKKPGAPHINNVELGKHGRNRTNVWDYAGVNSFGKTRDADLTDHPTVKPTALVSDALMDVSHRGDIVLDVFGGSGATLLAAEKTGRRARLIELDPQYVDVTIRRWQEMTGQRAVHSDTGETWDNRAAAVASKEKEREDV